MKEKTIVKTVIVGSVLICLYLLCASIFKDLDPTNTNTHRSPLYKSGDCVVWKYDNDAESWEKHGKYEFSYKILKVGKRKYWVEFWHGTNHEFLVGRETDSSFSTVDRFYVQINCETLEEIKK